MEIYIIVIKQFLIIKMAKLLVILIIKEVVLKIVLRIKGMSQIFIVMMFLIKLIRNLIKEKILMKAKSLKMMMEGMKKWMKEIMKN